MKIVNRRLRRQGCALLILALLSGCSQRFAGINDTVQEAFLGLSDIEISQQQLQDLPYASTYVRINDDRRVFMVLAYVEKNPKTGHNQLKWVSNDGGMIVTEQGRIVKTHKLFAGNLARRSGSVPAWRNNMPWSTLYDWPERQQYGHVGNLNMLYLGKQTITTPLWSEQLNHWQENITFPDLDASIHNQYWVNRQGDVLKSIQYLGPEMSRIEMEILKPYQQQTEVAQ